MKNLLAIATLVLLLVSIVACGSPAAPPASSPAPKPAGGGGAFALDVTPVLNGKAGESTTVTATTSPGAKCTITVTNPKTGTKSSYPTDKEKVADASGKAVWTWTIHRQVAKGDGTITVVAELNGQTVTREAVFRVTQSEY